MNEETEEKEIKLKWNMEWNYWIAMGILMALLIVSTVKVEEIRHQYNDLVEDYNNCSNMWMPQPEQAQPKPLYNFTQMALEEQEKETGVTG